MRVIRFAWHLFWAARQYPTYRLGTILYTASRDVDRDGIYWTTDTELTEALRRYGR